MVRKRFTGKTSLPVPWILLAVASLASMAPPLACAGEVPYGPETAFSPPTLERFASVAAADIDGDGIADAIYTYKIRDTGVYGAAWHPGRRGGSVAGPHPSTRHVIYEQSAISADEILATGDLDHDGDMDIAVAGSSGIRIFTNETGEGLTGDWQEFEVTDQAQFPGQVIAADMDLDGDLDFVGQSLRLPLVTPGLGWYENLGRDGSTWAFDETIIQESAPDHASLVALIDVDVDGDPDILTRNVIYTVPIPPYLYEVIWYENRTREGPDWPEHDFMTVSDTARDVAALASADVDADGDTDLVVGMRNPDRIEWRPRGTGDAWLAPLLVMEFDQPIDEFLLSVADIDQDGDRDILGAGPTTGGPQKILWYENLTGSGITWEEHSRTIASDGIAAISMLDLDDDHDGDIVFCTDSDVLATQRVAWLRNATIHANAGFHFDKLIRSQTLGVADLDTADVDLDGDADVIAAGADDPVIAWIETPHNPETSGPWTAHGIQITGPTDGVATADVDGDGDPDALMTKKLANRVVMLRNPRHTSTWPGFDITAALVGPEAIRAADMDGDGDQDAVIASYDPAPFVTDGRVTWHENLAGDGLSWALHDIATPDYPRSVTVVDLDADGDLDVLVVTSNPHLVGGAGDLLWYEHHPDGPPFWSAHVIEDSMYHGHSVAAADFDNDGDLDLATAIGDPILFAPGSVLWYENFSGDASTWVRKTVATPSNARRAVAAADLDRDGDTDIITISYSGPLVWYENANRYASAWLEHVITPGAESPGTVHPVDVDRDVAPDIVVTLAGTNAIHWWPSRGGQLSLITTSTAPALAESGRKTDVLSVLARHNGRDGDPGLEMQDLHLRFRDSQGALLTTEQYASIIDRVQLYLDTDGSGTWNPPADLGVATLGPAFAPGGTADGPISFTYGLSMASGDERRLFVVVQLTSDAHTQPIEAFAVEHVTSQTSSATYADYPIAVTVEPLDDVLCDTVTIVAADLDGDGARDNEDNCTEVHNADQRDTNGDNIGNACDADLDDSCAVNFGDLAMLKAAFFPRPYDPDADFDGDGYVNFGDLAFMKSTFFNGANPGPGPSGLPNACSP